LRGVDEQSLKGVAHRKRLQNEQKREVFRPSSAPGVDEQNPNVVASVNLKTIRKRREGFSLSSRRPFNKKLVLLFALILMNTLCAFAQDESPQIEQSEKKFAVSLGLEWNMNSRENFAGGAVLGFDFNLSPLFAIGLTATYSNNFSGISVIEPAALFRWYILGSGHSGFFAQADLGAYLVLEDEELTPVFLGGLRGGIRLPLGTSFYVEPYGRVGYPFVFGIGVMAGIRF